MRVLVITVLVVAGSSLAVVAGQNASVPVRERIITRHFPITIPPHPCVVPSSIQFIAGSVEAVSGVEYAPVSCDWRRPPSAPTEEIDLLGMTIQEALNTLVKLDPRYAWQESDGVIMMRPLQAWADDKHILHESIGPIEFESKPIGYVLDQLRPIVGQERGLMPMIAGNTPHGWHEFSVKLRVMSQLEALNEIVRAHGNLHWQVKYCRPEMRREYTSLMLYTTDKGGVGTGGGRRECLWK